MFWHKVLAPTYRPIETYTERLARVSIPPSLLSRSAHSTIAPRRAAASAAWAPPENLEPEKTRCRPLIVPQSIA